MFAMTFGAPLEEPLEKVVEAEFAAGALLPASFSTPRPQVRPRPALPVLDGAPVELVV